MKTPRIVNAVGHIDDDLVSGANRAKVVKKTAWLKWGAIAACFAIMMMTAVVTLPMLLDDGNSPIPPIDTTVNNDNEFIYEKGYFYNVDEGAFSTYVGGKVIAGDKIGNKISDVSVTAGWKNANNEWISSQKLRGEVYAINGVSNDVAVALKFIDKGEAVTTTHYYVIMNPAADLTPVKDYIITPITPNNSGFEGAVNEGEVLEGKLEKYYDYGINSGTFATYINGKVIDAEKVGAKLESVTVTGGWKNEAGEWISTEALNAEVYAIEGVSDDVAVALKFIDQGEAVTTTHYYVIMNPNADLTAVEDYIIAPIVPNNPGDEMVNE